MRETSCAVSMEFIDLTAADDAKYSSASAQSISKYYFTDDTVSHNYATSELNQFILDGTKSLLSTDNTFGWYSEDKSNNQTAYSTPQVLHIKFDSLHSTSGLTFIFDESVPKAFSVVYKNNDMIVAHQDYSGEPNTNYIYCKCRAINYNEIVLTVTETQMPDTFVKLSYILYGRQVHWAGAEIQDAKITEQIDTTSTTVAINTATISIIDTANDFDLAAEDGEWNFLQIGQNFKITEYVNDKEYFIGNMFLKKYTASKNILTFTLNDMLTFLDNGTFTDGEMYENKNARELITQILDDNGLVTYEISDDIAEHTVTGYLAPQTHRKALQQVLFAIGAVADTSRRDNIKIFMPKLGANYYIDRSRKFDQTKVTLSEYVSGVSTTYTEYMESDKLKTIVKPTLYPAGIYTINFTAPYYNYIIEGATLLESALNHVKINVETEGNVSISGYGYDTVQQTYNINASQISAGEHTNIKSLSKMTLFEYPMVKNKQLLSNYQLRKTVNMKYISENERVGDWVLVEQRDYIGQVIVTKIISQTIDLTGGFLTTAKCVGWDSQSTDFAYTGEIYAGERGLI